MRLASPLLVPLLILFPCSTWAQESTWHRHQPPLEFTFPRDHGSHPQVQTEWWYCTGLVKTEAGREFGLQLTFFRVGIDPSDPEPEESRLRARHVLLGHLAIADVEGNRFHSAERIARPAAGFAGAATEDLRVWIGDWEMRRSEGDALSLTAFDAGQGIGLDLSLEVAKPLVFQGEKGYSAKGPEAGNASAYLTWPRLATKGTIVLEGEEFRVQGETWIDHEWGTSQLGEGVSGWDWFGLRLEDGRELMLYRLRREDGTSSPYSAGTLIEEDGTSRRLGPGEYEMEVLSIWTSPGSGAKYPARWRLAVPSEAIEVTATPLVEDAEMDDLAATGVVYWEGPYRLEGTVQGEGYGEFTGYAGSLAGRF